MKLKRQLFDKHHEHGPSHGRDVRDFVKRTLHRAANELPLGDNFFPKPKAGFDPIYNAKTVNAVETLRHLQGRHPVKGPFRQDDLDALWPHADAYARTVYRAWTAPPILTPQDVLWNKLYASMSAMDHYSKGYILGASHGVPLTEVEYDDYFDCSSSCSKACFDSEMFYSLTQALVSGELALKWGQPGEGKVFTMYANYEHVWLRLHRSRFWRFDTSPHVDGRPSENPRRGPRFRYLPRFSSSFTARHWPGM